MATLIPTSLLCCIKNVVSFLFSVLKQLQEDAKTHAKLKHDHQVAVEKIKYQQAQIEMLNQVNIFLSIYL